MKTGRFFVLGDVQETSVFELAILGREKNEGIRESLIQNMIERSRTKRPDFVLLLGDLVFNKYSKKEWSRFEKFIEPIRSLQIPILACSGNHDLGSEDGGYSAFIYMDVGIIILNSCLTREKWDEQSRWLNRQSTDYENDPKVRIVIIFSHHPPYTNSIPKRAHRKIKAELLPILLRSDKFQLFVSGHAHTYERVETHGKTFIVSGGGGAPRVRLETDEKRKWCNDVSGIKESLRPFHFLDFETGEDILRCQVMALMDDVNLVTSKILDNFWK